VPQDFKTQKLRPMTKVQKRVDFEGQTIFAGIDVHLKSWSVSLFYDNRYLRSFQQPPDAAALATLLKRDYPGATYQCAYEAGFCGFWIQRALTDQGLSCIVVNAADVPQTDKGLRSKNDRNDSKRIGDSLKAGMLDAIYVPDTTLESDRRLVRYRQQLQRDLTRCKARIKSLLYYAGIALPDKYQQSNWSNLFLQWLRELPIAQPSMRRTLDGMIVQVEQLRKEVLELNRQLKQLLDSESYSQAGTLLRSVPGIGPIAAITLLVEIADIKRFTNFAAFNSFIGLCPSEHSSGEAIHRGFITPRHHRQLRSLLIEAAWVAVKHDPALTFSFVELKNRMPAKRAIIQIARKLLNRIWYVWNKKQSYEKGLIQ
jgi:transposase